MSVATRFRFDSDPLMLKESCGENLAVNVLAYAILDTYIAQYRNGNSLEISPFSISFSYQTHSSKAPLSEINQIILYADIDFAQEHNVTEDILFSLLSQALLSLGEEMFNCFDPNTIIHH